MNGINLLPNNKSLSYFCAMKNKAILIVVVLLLAAVIGYFVWNKNNSDAVDTPDTNGTEASAVANISYSVINSYPHDTGSYTQGLVIYKGDLYEGTGLNGRSRLMKVDLPTGKIEKSHPIDATCFGEGIVILNDTIYQLTWQNNKVFAYTLSNFKQVKEYPLQTEGWGITTNGKELIVSDGSSSLYYYEPSTFAFIRQQNITEKGLIAPYINELEFIDGFIYANQYMTPFILKIDPAKGEVVGKVDVTELWKRAKAKNPNADVPNGIAYDEATRKIYITGKLWPELHEVQFGQ